MRGNPIRFQIRIQLNFNFAPHVPSSIRLDTTFLHSVCIWRLLVHGTHVNSSDPLNTRLKKKHAAFFLEHIVSIKKSSMCVLFIITHQTTTVEDHNNTVQKRGVRVGEE